MWLCLVLFAALFAPRLSEIDPLQPVSDPLLSPRKHYPLGTDALGRDVWTRLLYGSRISAGASLLATAITLVAGGLIGLVAASLGGWIDRIILAGINAALAIPSLLLAMLLVAGLGPRLTTVILAVGFGGAPGFARMARSIFLQIRGQSFITAARALGADWKWISFFHLLPNSRSQLLSLTTTNIAWAFMGTTALTFLGLAGDPSIPEWGAMLDSGRIHILGSPWLAIWPGTAIALTILAIHAVGSHLGHAESNHPHFE
jgi:peptide/nickel transport system permease protein